MSIFHEYVGDLNIQEALAELCRDLIRSGLLTVDVEIIDTIIDGGITYSEQNDNEI